MRGVMFRGWVGLESRQLSEAPKIVPRGFPISRREIIRRENAEDLDCETSA